MSLFNPKITITNRITTAITRIERTRGFLEAATLSEDWVREMGNRALVLEAHHTTHIEGTRLTLDQAERLWQGDSVPEVNRRSLQRDMKAMVDRGLVVTEGETHHLRYRLAEPG